MCLSKGAPWSSATIICKSPPSAILCSGILLIYLVNSVRGLMMNLRRHTGVAVAALGVAAVSMPASAGTAPGHVAADAAVATLPGNVEYREITAIGMSEAKSAVVTETPVVIPSGSVGQRLFNAQCIACHGVDARGVDGLGASLVDSDFVASSSRDDLIAFLKVGRMPNDPASVTGLVMPGFAWIAAPDLAALAGYVKKIAE
jgi:mono/diheme cytochrome c family protein